MRPPIWRRTAVLHSVFPQAPPATSRFFFEDLDDLIRKNHITAPHCFVAGAALLHSLAVTEKRGSFRAWTVLLAIAAFSLCLLGTFLVRSGVLPAYPAGRLRATNRRRAMCQPVVAQAGGPWENGVFRCAARCGGHPGGTCPAGRGTAAPVLREPRPRCRSRPASAAEGTETGGLRQADRQK